jgi:alanine transaminase
MVEKMMRPDLSRNRACFQIMVIHYKKVRHSFQITRSMVYGEKDIFLVSFQSFSKGYYHECGRRGGYMEVNGFENNIKDQL